MIRRSVVVGRPVQETFRLFAERMGAWWPLEQFSYCGGNDLILEGRKGGRFYERCQDGAEHVIGEVLAYDPPHRLVFTWNQSNWAGTTEVEVRFLSEGSGTRVELEHRGWERIGPAGVDTQRGFDAGWGQILDIFARHALAQQA